MSILLKMAWRNVWRNSRRSLLTMAAIAFATLVIIFALSWLFGNFTTMINTMVQLRTGHIQIQALDYHQGQDIRYVVSDTVAIARMLAEIPGIRSYTFRAKAFSLVSSADRTYGVLVTGIQQREIGISSIGQFIRQGAFFNNSESNQALLGTALAQNLAVNLGDEITLMGQALDGSVAAAVFRVQGLFESGESELDRNALFIPLDYFQELFGMSDAVHEVVILCQSLDKVTRVKNDLNSRLSSAQKGTLIALDWKELAPELLQAIKVNLFTGLVFYGILVIIVIFSILNTFLMTIFERTQEFGIMLAVGCKPRRLMKLMLFESSYIIWISVAVGFVIGSIITRIFNARGIYLPGAAELAELYGYPDRMRPVLSVYSVSLGVGSVLLISFLTALYPVRKLRHLHPVEALVKR